MAVANSGHSGHVTGDQWGGNVLVARRDESVRLTRFLEAVNPGAVAMAVSNASVASRLAGDGKRRALLRAELDGIYAHLYGLSQDDFADILDTFPIVRRKDEERYGEYRTKWLCLEAYGRFTGIAAGIGMARGGTR